MIVYSVIMAIILIYLAKVMDKILLLVSLMVLQENSILWK